MADERVGADRKVGTARVEDLYALSRAVGDWGVKCSEGNEAGWLWYGRLFHDVEEIREVLIELARGENVDRDWEQKLLKPEHRGLVIERLNELGGLIGDWAGMCEQGHLKGWIVYGQLELHIQEMTDVLGLAGGDE